MWVEQHRKFVEYSKGLEVDNQNLWKTMTDMRVEMNSLKVRE